MSVALECHEASHESPAAPSAETSRSYATPSDGLAFAGEGRGLGGLVIKNLVLTLVSFGIYRFWARTALRRLVWSCTTVGGDALEYTGRGRELFVGFLVALVVLLPVLIVINIATSLIPPTDFVLLITAYAVIGLVFGLLGIVAQYHSRRYLLSRTRWRGLQAGQDAPLGAFFRAHAGPWLVTMLTLGLAAPWAAAKTYAYRMAHTHIGTGRFAAVPDVAALWRPFLPFWAALIAAVGSWLLFFGPIWVAGQQMLAAEQQGLPAPTPQSPTLHWFVIATVLGFAAWLLSIRYRAARFRLFAATTTLGGMRFACTLRGRDLGGALFGHIAFVALGMAAAALILFGLARSLGAYGAIGGGFALVVIVYAATYLSNLLWVLPRVMERVAGSLRIEDIGAADDFMNRGNTGPRRGEGLADALGDVGI